MNLEEKVVSSAIKSNVSLTEIRKKILVCSNCPLSKSRTNAVPGEGKSDAEIMFIGEAPGANEDKYGIPFCGAAGKFLDQMLGEIGLSRDEVFITNTVKCRPPENRDPEDSEKACCRSYLDAQFNLINPKIIVCLGRHSASTFLPNIGGISKIHGRAFKRTDGRIYLPLYHPAAALHNGGLRQTLIDDFKGIKKVLDKIKQRTI